MRHERQTPGDDSDDDDFDFSPDDFDLDDFDLDEDWGGDGGGGEEGGGEEGRRGRSSSERQKKKLDFAAVKVISQALPPQARCIASHF